jgi:hypothetical protein
MPDAKIHQLTLEQEALLFGCRDSWKTRALATGPIDRSRATEAVKMAYALSGYRDPDILFCASPLAALDAILMQLQQCMGCLDDSDLGKPIGTDLDSKILEGLRTDLKNQLDEELFAKLLAPPYSSLGIVVGGQVGGELGFLNLWNLGFGIGGSRTLEQQAQWLQPIGKLLLQFGFQQANTLWAESPFETSLDLQGQEVDIGEFTDQLGEMWSVVLGNEQSLGTLNCLEPELWASSCGLMDFFFSILKRPHNRKAWYVLQALVQHCGWVFPFARTAIVCDRPVHLLFDGDNRIHADGEPAIQYTDGFRVYAHHGMRVSGYI